MEEIKERVQVLLDETQRAKQQLNLEDKTKRLNELELAMSAPGFWDEPEKAQKLAQEAGFLRDLTATWQRHEQDLSDLLELSQMSEDDPTTYSELKNHLQNLEKQHSELRLQLFLSGPYDTHAAILSIHAGTGGVDAQDFAEMLERMFLRFCEQSGWKTTLQDRSLGEEAGIKSAAYLVEGPFAYGYLKHEAGVHRLVRLSPFNSKGSRETSFALIEVTPEIEEAELEIKEEDLKWDVFRSGGSGGQSVNTTDSAVRVTHLPTGLVVTCQNERSQLQNRQSALKTLKSKLVALQEQHHLAALSELKGEHVQTSWGNQIRSYVLHPYQMVKDHRTGYETSQTDKVLDGDLQGFIEASFFAAPSPKG